jgi:nucleotide-binding universal stress UspA family protein
MAEATTAEIRAVMAERELSAEMSQELDRLDEMQVSDAVASEDIYVPIPVPGELLEAVGNLILDEAESIAERHGAKGAERLMRYGEAAKTILQAADDLDANIIVMGSRGMSDLKGLLVGSVSHKVSNLADCTCVSVK